MKNIEKIKANLLKDKELNKNIKKLNYYTIEQFISDATRYIKAIKEGRMINSIGSVSSSGMSRTIKFLSCEKSTDKKQYGYYNFNCLFVCMGYSYANQNRDYFRICGCGMDMIFHTNYSNIHYFERIGLISKKECDYLAKQTPTTI